MTKAYLLGDPAHEPLSIARETDSLTVHGPAEPIDALDTVIVLKLSGASAD